MDLDQLIATLKAGGASQAQIDEVIDTYTKAKYEPEPVELHPAFYLMSDITVKIGKDDHLLRLVNVDDLRRALPKLIEFVRLMISENGGKEKVAEVLEQANPLNVISILMQRVLEMNLKGRISGSYPKWFVSVLEEVALLASTEARTLTAADLISLPPSQFQALLFKLVEVNQQDFLLLWASVPPAMRLTISTLVSRITNAAKRISTALSRQTASLGGAESTGNPTSSSPSEVPKAATSRKKVLAG